VGRVTDNPTRVERVLNLLALLLDTSHPLTRDEIVGEVSGYPAQASAYRRAFERDKEILRSMGVPITVEQVGDTGESGYRVRPEDYYLPDLGLTAEETAALRVAVSAVALDHPAGEGALMKLGSRTAPGQAPIASLPLVPVLAPLFDAFRRRAVVTFTHRGRARTLESWGLTSQRGHWYVVGLDHDRGAIRAFRADRIEGDVAIGPPDAFTIPDDFRPELHIEDRAWMLGTGEPTTVQLVVDAGYTDWIGPELGDDATVEPRADGSTLVTLPVVDRSAFRSFALGFLDHAEVLGPADVRADIVEWLETIASGPAGPA
jgi:proteasome accessory factor B